VSGPARSARAGAVVIAAVAAFAIVLLTGQCGVAAGAGASVFTASPAPTVRVEDQHGVAGPVRMVQLDGWPMGAVTIAVCGDAARRGSEDCDAVGAKVAAVPLGGAAATRLPSLTPPIDCPCVLRAATRDQQTVVLVPLEVPGRRVMRPDELPPLRHTETASPGTTIADPASVADGTADVVVALTLCAVLVAFVLAAAWRRSRRASPRAQATSAIVTNVEAADEDDFFVEVDDTTDPVLDDFFVVPEDDDADTAGAAEPQQGTGGVPSITSPADGPQVTVG